jgi:2-methylcitrate dehydratase PrpD
MSATAAEKLADHFTALTYDAIPNKHVQDAKTLVLDWLGVAVAGGRTGSGKIATRFGEAQGGPADATFIASGGKGPAMHAAFANAIASHSVELDDVDVLALFHFSPPVVAAALAVAETAKASGRDFLAAVVGGCEMMARASDATNNSLRDRGFHTTPTCGVFGAAVAAGMLLKLDRDQMISALGLAGAQASGLMEMYGPSMQKRFNPGPTARNGVVAAEMARMGFTGAATIFDGERGFCRAFSDKVDIARLTHKLGEEFPIHIEYKPYSCARPIHNAIDCALSVRRDLAGDLSKIRSMHMRRHPDWAKYHLNTEPKTYHEAQVSLPYSVAVALIDGAALLPQYRDERLADPTIRRLSKMLEVVSDASLPRGVSCRLTVETTDGKSFTAQVDHPRGSIKNPMTPDEMNGKVHLLADDTLGKATVDKLIAVVGSLEAASGVGDVTRLAAPKGH